MKLIFLVERKQERLAELANMFSPVVKKVPTLLSWGGCSMIVRSGEVWFLTEGVPFVLTIRWMCCRKLLRIFCLTAPLKDRSVGSFFHRLGGLGGGRGKFNSCIDSHHTLITNSKVRLIPSAEADI